MSKINDLVEGWVWSQIAQKEGSVIPKLKGTTIQVLLKGFKDALLERASEEGKFDPAIYKRYEEHGDIDFDLLGSDLESLNNETLNLNKEQLESESTRLMKRIIRVEQLSQKLNDTNVELILEDLQKVIE